MLKKQEILDKLKSIVLDEEEFESKRIAALKVYLKYNYKEASDFVEDMYKEGNTGKGFVTICQMALMIVDNELKSIKTGKGYELEQ